MEFFCQITVQPSLFPSGSFDELLDLLVHYSTSNINLFWQLGKSPLWGMQRNVNNFARPLNMVCMFIEIYWSLDEDIMKHYSIVFWSDFLKVSNNFYFSNMFAPQPLGEQRNILVIILVKKFYFNLVTQSLQMEIFIRIWLPD